MSTPPIPQTTVSQSGMLSRSPGAKNLPSRPMMMPAMITPMMSTDDPFHLLGRPCSGIARALAPRPTAQARIGKHPIAEVRGPLSEHLQGPTSRAGHGKADPRLDASGQLAQGRPPPSGNHPHQMRPAGGPRRHNPTACEPERDGCNPPESDP